MPAEFTAGAPPSGLALSHFCHKCYWRLLCGRHCPRLHRHSCGQNSLLSWSFPLTDIIPMNLHWPSVRKALSEEITLLEALC